MSTQIRESLQNHYNQLIAALPDLLTALVLFLIFLFIGLFLQRLLKRRLARRWKQIIVINFVSNTIKWFFVVIGVIAGMDILGFGGIITSLVTGAGVSAIIIGFAFKDIAENFLAGFLLAISRPFQVGNIIEVDGEKGTVRGMDLRTTHIRNVQGKDIYIPNAMMVKNVVANYTKDGLLRQEFVVGLDPEVNIAEATTLIMNTLKRVEKILAEPPPEVVVDQLGEFTVDFQIFFWVDILKRDGDSPSLLGITTRSEAIHQVHDRLLAEGYNMPSQVIEHKMFRDEVPLKVAINGR